jgi:hypothetical protein
VFELALTPPNMILTGCINQFALMEVSRGWVLKTIKIRLQNGSKILDFQRQNIGISKILSCSNVLVLCQILQIGHTTIRIHQIAYFQQIRLKRLLGYCGSVLNRLTWMYSLGTHTAQYHMSLVED